MPWYVILIAEIIALYWTMPNSWRINPRLRKIQFLKHAAFTHIDSSICFVGDCHARAAPFPVARLGVPKSDIKDLIPYIERAKLNSDLFVVITGTIAVGERRAPAKITEELEEVKLALLRKNPDSTVIIISPALIHQIAQIDGAGDGWHLWEPGYFLLLAHYPQIAARLNASNRLDP